MNQSDAASESDSFEEPAGRFTKEIKRFKLIDYDDEITFDSQSDNELEIILTR